MTPANRPGDPRHPGLTAASGSFGALYAVVLGWPGVRITPYPFGGLALTVGEVTFAHWHPSGVLGALCSPQERARLIGKGRARPHHFYAESNWVSLTLGGPGDVKFALSVLRHAYGQQRAPARQPSHRLQEVPLPTPA
jgi:hypothetical protein